MISIFSAICERIKANPGLFTGKGLEPIQHFDLFKGQYINPEMFQIYLTPALFYEYSVTWTDSGKQIQQGTCTVRVHLVTEILAESSDGSPDQEEALKIFDFYTLVNCLLHGLETEEFTPLLRKSEEPDLSPTSVYVHIIEYECTVTDTTTERMRQYINVQLDDLEIKRTGEIEPVPTVAKYVL